MALQVQENYAFYSQLIKTQDIIEGIPDVKEDYDKMSILMIYLNGTKKGRDKGEGFVRLLNTLLATDMTAEEKRKVLSEEYGIEIKDDFGEEMDHMCNLGEGIREEALEEGIELRIKQGIEQGIEQGMEQGLTQGRTQGEERKLIEQVCKKLKKEKTPDAIADELEGKSLIFCDVVCDAFEKFLLTTAMHIC